MAKLVAIIDFYDNVWGSQEMNAVFKNGTNEEKRDYLMAHGKCEKPREVDEDLIFDHEIGRGKDFVIYYDDRGMLESVTLVKL
jgi:hypothetical protein